MRFVRSLIYLTLAFQSMAASAAGDENERLSNILRRNTTPVLKVLHVSNLDEEKELGQSDKNIEKLVRSLLLQNQNITLILKNKKLILMRRQSLIHASFALDCKQKKRTIYFAELFTPMHPVHS